MATINGNGGDNNLVGTEDADTITGFGGNDTITGLGGADTAVFNVTTDGADTVDLGAGSDVVSVSADAAAQVRLTFTSAQVGNGNPNDSNTMMNQDGGLAVRLQAEDGSDGLTGPVSRYDDEGITFVGGVGVTFDVRDLVSGVQRGDQFQVVTLGTMAADTLTAVQAARPYYFNAGMGDDTITGGTANDFLVGGAGLDTLDGGAANDSYIGGGGNDTITDTGGGADTAIFNVTTDGADTVDLGAGSDVVTVASATPAQVRLTFTSAQVGNGNPNDSNTMMNQDGGLAVRLQAEDGSDGLTGPVSRYDDEGITFVGGAGVTFDVRDLVSGVQRGDQFQVATLGTMAADTLTAVQAARPYYFNAGMGDDTITGGTANDFLVGGAGSDRLEGGAGDDQHIGGAGNDRFVFSLAAETGSDTIIDFQKVDLFVSDARLRDGNNDGIINFGSNGVLDLDAGNDTVAFTGIAPQSGLRFLGQLGDGNFAYADAATRPMGATEGTLAGDSLSGAGGARSFFFDTALGLDFGNDRITDFGNDDLLVTTTAIADNNSDGRIDFGGDRTLDLADGTEVRINNGSLRSLEFDGSVTMNGATYFVYSRVGSSATGTDDLFG
jgi:Ca2+-binding RTX toxin-like protein